MEGVMALLSGGSIDIDQGDPKGTTPLMVAASWGHLSVVRMLLNRRANVSIADEGGYTALHFSAHYRHLTVTVDLMKAGADLDAGAWEGNTPLFLAAYAGHSQYSWSSIDKEGIRELISPRVVRLLAEAGADTASAFRVTITPGGMVDFNGTPLAFANRCLLLQKTGMMEGAREEQ
eukprot:g18347.t1